MLGHDMRVLLNDDGIARVGRILSEQVADAPASLPNEMDANEPDRARVLVDAMLRGLLEYRPQ